jgi:Tfp pilus assembly protein PilW
MTVLMLCVTGLARMMIENARLNRAQQMTAQAQATARNCLSMVVQRLRSAGWDPLNAGIPSVALDADMSDDVSEIEIYADIDQDGVTSAQDEQVLIRHVGSQVVWRRTSDASDPWLIVATNISNDEDGDGVPEPMFIPDSLTDPTVITVRVTAESPSPHPVSGEMIRYTVSSDVTLRKLL